VIAVLDLVLWLVEGSLTFTAPVSGAPTDSACSLPSMLGFAVSSAVRSDKGKGGLLRRFICRVWSGPFPLLLLLLLLLLLRGHHYSGQARAQGTGAVYIVFIMRIKHWLVTLMSGVG